ncbi:MAG: sugar ABC transporter permease [Chloroflexi bacterium]|jgi:ABC-type maltose transport system permease subunit|nr:sugar ABC transporter permease [Chloroflexota bacterium]
MSSLRVTGSSQRGQRRLGSALRYVVAIIAITFALFPVIWVISASVNPSGSLASQELIPDNASLANYRVLLGGDPRFPFLRWLWNSFYLATITSILAVFITSLSAYAFSRFRFAGRRNLLLTLFLIQVFPNTLAMVALFLLLVQLGQYIPQLGVNSHGGLLLIYLGGVMGINVWLMKGFFDSIPRDIDESAMVDGATHWQIFWQLIFPLVRPILVVVGILTFIGVYGDFLIARVMLTSSAQYTVMVGLWVFIADQFSQNWGTFAAGGLMAAIPIVVIYLFLQDQIVGGLTVGSVKG